MLLLSSETYSIAPNKKPSSYMRCSSLYNKISQNWSFPPQKKKKKNSPFQDSFSEPKVGGLPFLRSWMTSPSSFRADSLPNMKPYLRTRGKGVIFGTGREKRWGERKSGIPEGDGREDGGGGDGVKECEPLLHRTGPPSSSPVEDIQLHLRGSKWAGIQSPSSFLGFFFVVRIR